MLRIDIDLMWPSFHGLRDDRSVDFPPSPVRLLGALISGAHALDEPGRRDVALEAVDQVAAAPPPVIRVPDWRDLGMPDTYTEGSWIPDKALSGTGKAQLGAFDSTPFDIPTVSRVAKPQGAVALAGTRLTYDINGVVLSQEHLDALDAAARRVPYFGRSMDVALVTVAQVDDDANVDDQGDDDRLVLYPSRPADGPTRGWTPATPSWYATNFERTFSSDSDVAHRPLMEPTGEVAPLDYRPYQSEVSDDLDIVRFEHPLAQWDVPRLLDHLWHALEQTTGERPTNWALMPLTISRGPHADGRAVGIALRWVGPTADLELGDADAWRARDDEVLEVRTVVTRALDAAGEGLDWHTVFVRDPDAFHPQAWTAPSRSWQSTTPLRAFPDVRVANLAVRRWAKEATGLEPDDVRMTADSLARIHHRWAVPDRTDGLGQWWASVHFPAAVRGPVILGPDQRRGFGVFQPDTEAQS